MPLPVVALLRFLDWTTQVASVAPMGSCVGAKAAAVAPREFFFIVHFFFSIYRTRILLMQITELGQHCIRRTGKEHFVSAGRLHGLLLYPPDAIGGFRAAFATRTQPAKQRAPKNSLFSLLCIIFSRGKYFGCFIYE
jgi:hypothetical protein